MYGYVEEDQDQSDVFKFKFYGQDYSRIILIKVQVFDEWVRKDIA